MIDINAPTISRLNRQIYQRLKQALSLNLRRQIFIAVCDNQHLKNNLAQNLEADLTNTIDCAEQQPNNNRHMLLSLIHI